MHYLWSTDKVTQCLRLDTLDTLYEVQLVLGELQDDIPGVAKLN